MLYIDPRAGSNRLIGKFFEDEFSVATLQFGDVAFYGNGPDKQWYIGVEYKTIPDMVASIKSGRFTGTQMPGMLAMYDACFLVIEGVGVTDHATDAFYDNAHIQWPVGMSSTAFTNFQTSLTLFTGMSGKPFIVVRTSKIADTVHVIRATHAYFQKEWKAHTSLGKPDDEKTKKVHLELAFLKEPLPDAPEYPKYALQRMLFQVHRLGWETSGRLAEKAGTMENLLQLSPKDIMIDGLGDTMAKRVFFTLHGYLPPVVKKSKKKELTDGEQVESQ